MQDLKSRSKGFALDVIRHSGTLPRGDEFKDFAPAVAPLCCFRGSDYRAARRAESKADFTSVIGDAEEETDESLLWLECLAELATREHAELNRLLKEANELVEILTASRKTARG